MEDTLDFESFIDTTCNILEEDGFDAYLPTLYAGGECLVVEGIPATVADTDAINDLGPKHGLGEPGTFFAVLAAPRMVLAGEFTSMGWRFVKIQHGGSGLTVTSAQRPSWFRL
jgi:hypothetical protein